MFRGTDEDLMKKQSWLYKRAATGRYEQSYTGRLETSFFTVILVQYCHSNESPQTLSHDICHIRASYTYVIFFSFDVSPKFPFFPPPVLPPPPCFLCPVEDHDISIKYDIYLKIWFWKKYDAFLKKKTFPIALGYMIQKKQLFNTKTMITSTFRIIYAVDNR